MDSSAIVSILYVYLTCANSTFKTRHIHIMTNKVFYFIECKIFEYSLAYIIPLYIIQTNPVSPKIP